MHHAERVHPSKDWLIPWLYLLLAIILFWHLNGLSEMQVSRVDSEQSSNQEHYWWSKANAGEKNPWT